MVPECKPEWNREAIAVFSRLPSLRRLHATPPLQIFLELFAYPLSIAGNVERPSVIAVQPKNVLCLAEATNFQSESAKIAT